ncbi:SPOR domain-containing protein [Sphingoaurantiacus capsulatus]|uniref:SPOR domain-containing protein n=1 Tax=Sphingoaurantiacus capsulatus TaxID=1771310 RepID=A0ABV7XAD5_9SPHN
MRRLALAAVAALVALPALAQPARTGNEDPARLVALGERMERSGELTGAMVFYERAINIDPAYPLALRAAGNNAMTRGVPAEAARFYSTWANTEPRNPEALISLASTLIAQQKPDEALALLARAEDLNGNKGRISAQRGIALDLQGNTAGAQAAYAAALDLNPADAVTTQRMALSLALGGQNGAAVTLMQRFGPEPEAAEVRRTLALIHALGGRQGDAGEAAAALFPIAEAQKMRNFYAQLPRMPLRERAIAVHFGIVPGVGPVSMLPMTGPPARVVTTQAPAPKPAQETIRTTAVPPPAPRPTPTPPAPAPTPAAPVAAAEAPLTPALLASRPRIWVQVSSLADGSRLGVEWRRIRGAAGDTLAGQQPYVQRAGATNRLLVGPYASEWAARSAIAKLKARRVDSIINRTPKGASLAPLTP